MKSRAGSLAVAVVLALLATGGVAGYVNGVRNEVARGWQMVEVLVAARPVAAGMRGSDLVRQNMVRLEKVPRRYVADGAISSAPEIEGKVLSTSLPKGAQLTTASFADSIADGLGAPVPEGMVAIAVPVDEVRGVAGKIKPGHRVAVLVTLSPGPGGFDMTRILLSNVLVLGSSYTDASAIIAKGATNIQRTVTLAVSPSDAEKLVFAEEKGHVWLALMPPQAGSPPSTSGQSIRTILR